MAAKRAPQYLSEMPLPSLQGRMMHIAVRIVESFPKRVPEVSDLMSKFGMSKATAYRWRAAVYYARAGA